MEHSNGAAKLRAHKVVLPVELLKDVAESEDGHQCLAPDVTSDGFFYIPDFISEAEETYLLEKINSAPLPKWKALQARSGHDIGRLQYWGGQLSKQTLIPEPMPDFLTQFPPFMERLAGVNAFQGSKHGQFNHCLVNEYEAGQGIMPHEDGGAYFPAVATVSLGGHALLDIYRYADVPTQSGHNSNQEQPSGARAREQDPRFAILQERRSLLLTKGTAYREFLHGIAQRGQDDARQLAAVTNGDMLSDKALQKIVKDAKTDPNSIDPLPRTLRISLTFRDVEKVAPKGLMSMLAKR